MVARQAIEVEGLGHGTNPIPTGARVGPLICSSAIMGANLATGAVPEEGLEQVRLVFENMRRFLSQAGAEPDDVVRVGVLLSAPELRGALNEEWVAMFPEESSRPARHTTLRDLANGMVVQLEVIAYREQS